MRRLCSSARDGDAPSVSYGLAAAAAECGWGGRVLVGAGVPTGEAGAEADAEATAEEGKSLASRRNAARVCLDTAAVGVVGSVSVVRWTPLATGEKESTVGCRAIGLSTAAEG
jgi:hypothetical protein